MYEKRFWSNKVFVEQCLINNKIKYQFAVYTPGRGHRGVYFRTFGITYSDFIKTYGRSFKDKNCSIFITLDSRFPDIAPMYVYVKRL